LLHNHPHLSSGAGTIGQKWLQYNGLTPIPLAIIIKKNCRKPEGKRALGRSRHRWKDSIQMDLREIDGTVWTGLIWLRIRTSGGLL
jgi:hypothetical protein